MYVVSSPKIICFIFTFAESWKFHMQNIIDKIYKKKRLKKDRIADDIIIL